MSYSFIAISDQHLEHALFNLPELRQDLFDKYRETVDKAIELKVDYFISVGDLFDTNKPSSATVEFVLKLNNRLIENNIIPLAISGDHSKSIDNVNWERIAGFKSISDHPNFAAVDYNDNQTVVKQQLLEQLRNKKDNVEFIFAHAQIPELFSFIEEKKALIIDWEEVTRRHPRFKGAILGDVHNGISKTLPTGQFLGYCGSLGVTRLDEINGKFILYYDGIKLNKLKNPLIREFFIIKFNHYFYDNFEEISSKEVEHLIENINNYTLSSNGKKPVVIIKYNKKLYHKLYLLNELYKYAIVRTTLLPSEDKLIDINVNFRSEICNNATIESVLTDVLKENNTYTQETFDIGISLIEGLLQNNTKEILNNLKKKYIYE
jgi:Calcineurin-like phosphoesterase